MSINCPLDNWGNCSNSDVFNSSRILINKSLQVREDEEAERADRNYQVIAP